MTQSTRQHLEAMRAAAPFLSWFPTSRYFAHQDDANIADFMFGNPQHMPIPAYVSALSEQVVPRNKSWFAYKTSEREARRAVAKGLAERTGVLFESRDVVMTTGGFSAIAVALRTLCGPGDEVVFLPPPWFFYELLILSVYATPVRVPMTPPTFDLPVDAIARSITPRTRAVLVNSPHNPSGRVWSKDDLAALARVLEEASKRVGHRIWILSDEAYAKIVYDGGRAASPAEVYPHTIVLYSYGKQLLAPGQRIGFAAVPPSLPEPERAQLRSDALIAQHATGFAFPNAVLQYALADIDGLSIDIGELQRRRDKLVPALRAMGFETTMPAGTFYVLVKAPASFGGDDAKFASALADRATFVLPGRIVELPGWVRISLTASDSMIDTGLEAFRSVVR